MWKHRQWSMRTTESKTNGRAKDSVSFTRIHENSKFLFVFFSAISSLTEGEQKINKFKLQFVHYLNCELVKRTGNRCSPKLFSKLITKENYSISRGWYNQFATNLCALIWFSVANRSLVLLIHNFKWRKTNFMFNNKVSGKCGTEIETETNRKERWYNQSNVNVCQRWCGRNERQTNTNTLKNANTHTHRETQKKVERGRNDVIYFHSRWVVMTSHL